jgi:hypothetical protein|tara:strand:+ start:28 stop:711 length:684 start_codon:yes stop_codon:yes gene_type:complete
MKIGVSPVIPARINLPGQAGGGAEPPFEYTAINNSFSMLFDPPSGSYFTITDDIFGGMTEFTIAFWYYAESLSGDKTVLGRWTGFSDIILYHDSPDGWRILMSNASPSVSRQSNVVGTAGVWQHLVCKYTGSEVKFYLNGGATTDTAPNAATTIPSFTDMNVGIDLGGPASGRPWNGKLDELAIWSVALSDETVQAIYNATANNPGKVADLSETPEGQPTAWYRMGD